MSHFARIETSGAPAAIGPYSQAVKVRGWVYVSGQIPLDPYTGQLLEGDIRAATRQCLANLEAILHAAGRQKTDVVKTTVYLADLADFQAMNEEYAAFFGEHKPARACIQAAALPKGARVEIDAVACGEE